MEKLKHGHSVDIPKYDFGSYKTDTSKSRKVSIYKLDTMYSMFSTHSWVKYGEGGSIAYMLYMIITYFGYLLEDLST